MLKDSKGASLVMVLVFSAIAMGVIAALIPRLMNLGSAYERTALRANYIRLIGNLRSSLRDPFTCRLALANQPLGGPVLGDSNNSLVIGALTPGLFEDGTIQAGWKNRAGTIEIIQARMITTQPAAVLSRVVNLDKPSPALTSYQVRINFDVRDPTKGILRLNSRDPGFRFPEYHIDLTANIDPLTGLIYSCHGQDSFAEACEMAGGAFDASADLNAYPQLRCHPNVRCWSDHVGIRRTPAPLLLSPAVPPVCAWPYNTPNWLGRTSGEDIWLCQWCNNKIWLPGVN